MPNAIKVLIVDDCPEDREIYREYLSDDPDCAYEFLEAPRAETGLAMMAQEACDIVLLDFYLPDMTGLEFVDKLRQQKSSSAPIIMLTGQGDAFTAVQAMKEGVQDYLVKQQLQPEHLQIAIGNVVRQSSLQALLDKTQDRQLLVATTALKIRQSLTLDDVLNTAITEVQQLLMCDQVTIYQCHEGQPSEMLAELGKLSNDSTDIATLIADSVASPFLISRSDVIAVPIVLAMTSESSPVTWGYLVAQQSAESRPWQEAEELLLSELTIQITLAIQQAQMLAQVQSALTKSEAVNAFKSQIIATVSHEYRSPLAAILAAASTIDQHYEKLDRQQRRRFLTIIQDKSRYLAKLVDDMLLVHQCELDTTNFEPTPTNILQFLADLVEEYREAMQTDHELSLKTTGKTTGFWCDQGLLKIALNNLITNAIKYSPNGGEIAIALSGQADAITISVTDQGIGIPSADCAALFQSFSRASNVDTIPGIAMGLAIAKACVELHSGDILLVSHPDCGTTFTMHLPKQPPCDRGFY
jgi:signal transduction histidine kinase